jgi:phosphoserine phosphatase
MLRRYFSDNRLQIDLEKSFAYADSIIDIPILDAVGHPVAVGPDAKLLEVAKKNCWQIIVA